METKIHFLRIKKSRIHTYNKISQKDRRKKRPFSTKVYASVKSISPKLFVRITQQICFPLITEFFVINISPFKESK